MIPVAGFAQRMGLSRFAKAPSSSANAFSKIRSVRTRKDLFRQSSEAATKNALHARYFSRAVPLLSQSAPIGGGFGGSDEFQRLSGTNRGLIDEKGNYTSASGVKMPTQSSGGLTKRNNTDIGSLDVFEETGAVVTAYSDSGFVISEEYTDGSILCFPDRFWSWKVTSLDDITIEKLSPIWLRNPVPKILVLGTGATLVRPSAELTKFLLVRGISTEVSSTANAISTFNFLVQEESVAIFSRPSSEIYVVEGDWRLWHPICKKTVSAWFWLLWLFYALCSSSMHRLLYFVAILVIICSVCTQMHALPATFASTESCFAPALLNLPAEGQVEPNSLEVAVRVLNCFFEASMPDWVVDCGTKEVEMSTSMNAQECIQQKFRGMRYAVLGAFQGYLSQLPLQHRHLLFLTTIQQHSEYLFHTLDLMAQTQQDTLQLQREAINSFETTQSLLSTAIKRYLTPITHIMPTVNSIDHFTSDIETQMGRTEEISRILLNSIKFIIPAASAVSFVLSLSFRETIIINTSTNACICILTAIEIIRTPWALFLQILTFLLIRLLFRSLCHKNATTTTNQHKTQGMARLQAQSKQWNDLTDNVKNVWVSRPYCDNRPPY